MDDQDSEEEDKRPGVNSAVYAHPTTNEDEICVFHGVLVECLPSEDENF